VHPVGFSLHDSNQILLRLGTGFLPESSTTRYTKQNLVDIFNYMHVISRFLAV